MIVYFDTSAFIPLLVQELASRSCRSMWDEADQAVSSRLLYVETCAALAQATRMRRLSEAGRRRTLVLMDELWTQLVAVDLDDALARRAGALARRQNLRGYGAVHCASAELINDANLVAATGDQELLRAWGAIGVATYDTTATT